MSESAELTNDQLIADPAQTMELLAEGVGHFLRLALAGYVYARPEVQSRMVELLNSSDEHATLTASLSRGVLTLKVGVQQRDMKEPVLLFNHQTALPALIHTS